MSPVRKVPAMVQAKVVATIKAESKGVVNALLDVGSFVKKDETLAELTDTQSKLRSQELQDAVKSSKARYEFLKAEKARLADLVAKNLISKTELEQNQSDFLSAQSELAQSQSRLNQYKDQVTKLTIKAPYDGYVLQQLTQIGALLNSGDSVIELMQADNLDVTVFVPFKYKAQIKNQTVWQVQTEQGEQYDAVISKFTPAAIGQSHTIEVHLDLNHANLWSGEPVNVIVPTQTAREVIAIPRDALVIRRSGAYVYTVVDAKAVKVDVQTGMASGDMIEVTGNLKVGQTIIIRGNERIRPGSEVKVIN
jgi:RND family efflux transporter MFP subunit